jgi:histidinol-phosphate/aromatic aminotransferase/cobyric acid decarboxylase-like protein
MRYVVCNEPVVFSALAAAGSDDAISLICQTYLAHPEHGKRVTVLVPTPTYEQTVCTLVSVGAAVVRYDSPTPFAFDIEHLIRGIEAHTPDLVYIVSPCNPTGTECTPEHVLGLLNRFPRIRFVVDEAYGEFGTIDPRTGEPSTVMPIALEHENLIVTRSPTPTRSSYFAFSTAPSQSTSSVPLQQRPRSLSWPTTAGSSLLSMTPVGASWWI